CCAPLLRVCADGQGETFRLFIPAGAFPFIRAASFDRSRAAEARSGRAQRAISKKDHPRCARPLRLRHRDARNRRSAHPTGAPARSRRTHHRRARLRHEISPARCCLRQDESDGRRRRDRAAGAEQAVGASMTQRTKPPFRADHVGSLLRSAALKEARAKREKGEITPEELKAIEDREIEALISKQEATGLKSITDGEYRRASWQTDFLVALDGVEAYVGERKFKFKGQQPRPILLRINKKLGGYTPHPMIEHFKFVRSRTKATPKMTIPSPSTLHFRYGRDAVPEAIYPSMDDFYRDLGTTFRKTVRAFADAGCRYLQLDEVNLTYLCDPELRKQVTVRGDDPDQLPVVYANMINAAISDIPSDMTITMHLCRGNF